MELLIAMSIVIGFIIFLALGTWAEGQIDLRVGSYIKFRRNFEYRFDKYYVEGQSGYITRIEINSVGWPVYHVDINGQEVKFDWASASNVIRLRDPRKSKSKHN